MSCLLAAHILKPPEARFGAKRKKYMMRKVTKLNEPNNREAERGSAWNEFLTLASIIELRLFKHRE